jgi:hypothetical protein
VRRIDIVLLALLCSARQQDYERIAVATETDSIAGPEVEPAFEHAFADGFNVGDVTLLQPGNGARDSRSRYRVQFRKPLGDGRVALDREVVAYFRHGTR